MSRSPRFHFMQGQKRTFYRSCFRASQHKFLALVGGCLCPFISEATLSALTRFRNPTFSCSKQGNPDSSSPYRLLLSTQNTLNFRFFKGKHISVDRNTVEPPVSDHPKSKDFNRREEVADKNRTTWGFFSSVSDTSTFWERIYCMQFLSNVYE